MDSKHDLAIFSLGPDPVSVPVEEQRTVLAHAGINRVILKDGRVCGNWKLSDLKRRQQ